jgi:hypothetical protein
MLLQLNSLNNSVSVLSFWISSIFFGSFLFLLFYFEIQKLRLHKPIDFFVEFRLKIKNWDCYIDWSQYILENSIPVSFFQSFSHLNAWIILILVHIKYIDVLAMFKIDWSQLEAWELDEFVISSTDIASYQLNPVLDLRLEKITCIIECISAIIIVIKSIECISGIESEWIVGILSELRSILSDTALHQFLLDYNTIIIQIRYIISTWFL